VGERAATLSRLYNIREGIGKDQDRLPARFFSTLSNGPLSGVTINTDNFKIARDEYYKLMGWDINGVPTMKRMKSLSLDELGLDLG
jgi:aldehyde:ferredoxin oxidoreductase